MPPESYRPFDRRGRELGARRSPPARFSSLPTCRESLQQQKPKQSKTPLTQITLQNLSDVGCSVFPISILNTTVLSRLPLGGLGAPWTYPGTIDYPHSPIFNQATLSKLKSASPP